LRLKRNALQPLSDMTGIDAKVLSEYASARIRPGAQRSFELEDACKKIGINIPARLWVMGSASEIKAALSNQTEEAAQAEDNRKEQRRSVERRALDRRKSHERRTVELYEDL